MIGFLLVAPFADAIAKLIGVGMPLAQFTSIRVLMQVGILLPIVLISGRPLRIRKYLIPLIVVRGALHVFGIGAMVLSLRYLPLADAVAIAYVMPFIMLILGYFFLDELVGWRRIAACAAGFCGTLMVVQPSFASVGWPALLPLLVALDFALFMMVTRQLAKQIDPISLHVLSGLVAMTILLPIMVFQPFGWREFGVANPSGEIWRMALMCGVLGTIAHLFMGWSLRYAPSTTLAPMQYLEIPVATLYGWIIFSDFPNGLAFAGIVVTMAAGLYIVFRENAVIRSGHSATVEAETAAKG